VTGEGCEAGKASYYKHYNSLVKQESASQEGCAAGVVKHLITKSTFSCVGRFDCPLVGCL